MVTEEMGKWEKCRRGSSELRITAVCHWSVICWTAVTTDCVAYEETHTSLMMQE